MRGKCRHCGGVVEAPVELDTTYRNPTDGYEMVLIPAGRAEFGWSPRFAAELPAYYIGLYCVTNAQYAAFLNAVQPSDEDLGSWIVLRGERDGPAHSPSHCKPSHCRVARTSAGYEVDGAEEYAEHPIVDVSWNGAQAYCDWAKLRLPSELEWEKAARGPDGRGYPWGDVWEPSRCRSGSYRELGTGRVDELPDGRSPYGPYGMSGNVDEWCADWYDSAAYRRYAEGDLRPQPETDYKVFRGGNFSTGSERTCHARHRGSNPPWSRAQFGTVGFRCARDP